MGEGQGEAFSAAFDRRGGGPVLLMRDIFPGGGAFGLIFYLGVSPYPLLLLLARIFFILSPIGPPAWKNSRPHENERPTLFSLLLLGFLFLLSSSNHGR